MANFSWSPIGPPSTSKNFFEFSIWLAQLTIFLVLWEGTSISSKTRSCKGHLLLLHFMENYNSQQRWESTGRQKIVCNQDRHLLQSEGEDCFIHKNGVILTTKDKYLQILLTNQTALKLQWGVLIPSGLTYMPIHKRMHRQAYSSKPQWRNRQMIYAFHVQHKLHST